MSALTLHKSMINKHQIIKTSDFDYDLPRRLIAQTPVEPRDHSRLMIVDKVTGRISHSHFYQLPNHVSKGDVFVFNDSRVIPARLHAYHTLPVEPHLGQSSFA